MTADDCRNIIIEEFSKRGADVVVSTEPPIIQTPYDHGAFVCPHGIRYYMAPTSEQIAAWARDGVQ